MNAPVPALAAWLLRTLGSGNSVETLLGDLTEEYHEGRNRLWFWRQALAAIVVTFFAEEEQAMRRRLLYILVPTLAGAAITAAVTRVYLPTRYQSEAAVLVVPQQVSRDLVRPMAVDYSPSDRLMSLSQRVMSRTRLERIILDFNLYQPERAAQMPMEDIIERMRGDIYMKLEARPGDNQIAGFRVGYRSPDPRQAMRVTERLASLMIDENLRSSEMLTAGTQDFLDTQIENTRQQIIKQETELRAMRARAGAASLSDADLVPYEVLKDTYKTLLVKRQEAMMSASLDRRQIGEQFRMIDPARLPERAIGPNRSAVNMAGAGIGLGLGFFGILIRRKKLASRGDREPVNGDLVQGS